MSRRQGRGGFGAKVIGGVRTAVSVDGATGRVVIFEDAGEMIRLRIGTRIEGGILWHLDQTTDTVCTVEPIGDLPLAARALLPKVAA